MILCKVIGNVTSSHAHKAFEGHKIMVVQPLDENGNEKGKSFLSCDSVQAGPGDIVLVQQEGNTAREMLGKKDDPFHSVIVGIVDSVKISIKDKVKTDKK